jgi:cysteine desulfurase
VSGAPLVDALGTYCPAPLRLLAGALERVPVGGTVTLLADDPLIEVDLVAWCHERGHALLELVQEDGAYRAVVRRGS